MGIISNLLFGDNSNKTSYKDAAYQKRLSDITNATWDSMYGGLKDQLDRQYGSADQFKYDTLSGLKKAADESLANYNANKNNAFGNGLIGAVLNPIAQTVSSAGDLAGLAISGGKANPWDSSKDPLGVHRDVGSDLGALGETALTVIPMAKGASLSKAGKAVQAGNATAKQAAKYAASQVPKSLGQKIANSALFGAGYGATGSLRDMGFENFDPGQFALSTGIGAGVSGGLAGLGGLWNKYTSSKVPTTDATPYQDALNNLKNNATGARYSDVATNLPTTQGPDLTRITLNNLDDDTLKTLYKNGLKNVRSSTGANEATTAIKNSKDLLQDFLDKGLPNSGYERVKAKNLGDALKNLKTNVGNTKVGNKVSSLLKTKKGKVAAGLGGGLLLSQLMRGRNSNSGELTDEEMQELYNYIYGGGQ